MKGEKGKILDKIQIPNLLLLQQPKKMKMEGTKS